jgi:hypothetical protein
MNNKNSYFECQRCDYKCDQKINMIRHFDRKNLCIKKFDAYKYTDEELYEKSMNRTYINPNNNPNECSKCNKTFHTKYSLRKHMKKICKIDVTSESTKPILKPNEINDSHNLTAETTSINDSNIDSNNNNSTATFADSDQNMIDNSINKIDNSINNINITIVNSFDEAWSTSHIDSKTKVLLLLNQCKFTATLENILENEVNLNVLIDKKSENGIIYENNTMKNTTVKDIVSRTMEKIYKHLTDFKTDGYTHNIDNGIIDSQIKIAGEKYGEFKRSKKVQDKVNTCIKDIYCKKQTIAHDSLSKVEKDGY